MGRALEFRNVWCRGLGAFQVFMLKHSSNACTHIEVGGPNGNAVHIVIMEEIAGVVGNWLSRLKSKQHLAQLTLEIFEVVKSLKEHDLTHADLHINNIG